MTLPHEIELGDVDNEQSSVPVSCPMPGRALPRAVDFTDIVPSTVCYLRPKLIVIHGKKKDFARANHFLGK